MVDLLRAWRWRHVVTVHVSGQRDGRYWLSTAQERRAVSISPDHADLRNHHWSCNHSSIAEHYMSIDDKILNALQYGPRRKKYILFFLLVSIKSYERDILLNFFSVLFFGEITVNKRDF